MSSILSIAKKELRAYFLSPVALIFLGAFLFFTLLTFFGYETFFSRGVADVRPLFKWLPILLIFLGGALTMRLWSEEQKLGTLEVLLTLPVRTHELVVGKFLAALALVAVALALTLGVPITVSMLGDLDWGPVIGGYVGALLVAGAYLAIGLCISSLTDNQIVALISTCLICGLFYAVGAEWVTGSVGAGSAEILSAVGTGSRFESVRRGVLDIRDLAYYASIIVTFLALNTVILKAKGWSTGARTAGTRRNTSMAVALIGANALVLNVLLHGVTGLRVDLTERGEYSISKTTKDLVKALPEPVLIRGYFSEKTHPLLAPMVPRIKDMIAEYGTITRGRVITEFVDPREDQEMEKEANQLYGIRTFPFRIADRLDQAVVNSYFSILVKYGDEFQVLNFGDLIEVQVSGVDNIEVKLRNLEYDLTRAIKRVAYGFQTLDAVFANFEQPAKVLAVVTPETLPENFKEAPEKFEKVLKEIAAEAGGKFEYEVVNPDAPGAKLSREQLFKRYGLKPFAASLFSQETFYVHLLLQVGDRYEPLLPPESMSEADLKKDLTSALKRAAPGFLKTIGLARPDTKEPDVPPQFRQHMPPTPPDVTQVLKKQLGETYTVEDVDLKSGTVPGHIDVLLVYAPESYDDKQRFAIDQHMMRGGTVVVIASKFELDPHGGQSIKVKKVTTGLEELLASHGVTLQDAMVLDAQNEPIPMPVERDIGNGVRIREIQYLKYPYFVDVRSDGMADGSPVSAGLPGITLPWATALTVTTPEKGEGEDAPSREATVLLRSSKKAWTQSDTNVQPDFAAHPGSGFGPPPSDTKSQALAVLVRGSFESFFKEKKNPLAEGDSAGTMLERSPENTRLAVVGSTAFVSDLILNLTRQAPSNLQLLQNMVDWGVEDVDLLGIRSRGTFARTLLPMEAKQREIYELANYGAVVVALLAMVAFTYGRRRRMTPLDLDGASHPAELARVATKTNAEARS